MKFPIALFLVFAALFNPLISFSYAKESLDKSNVKVEFNLVLDKEIYELSDFGEPPQIAVWIKLPGDKKIKTISVTRRTARNIWKGKIECPTSLPIWKSQAEKSTEEPDAFSSATPKNEIFRSTTYLKKGICVDCYFEVNVSGDFNAAFPYRNIRGMPDPQLNGQPSLIYHGKLIVKPGSSVKMKLKGRSDQWVPVISIISDLSGISSAKKLIKRVSIKCF